MSEDLRALAEAATPGPWHNVAHRWPERGVPVLTHDATDVAVAMTRTSIEQRNADAAYIAAASPDRILALLTVVDAARELVYGTGGTIAVADALDELAELA